MILQSRLFLSASAIAFALALAMTGLAEADDVATRPIPPDREAVAPTSAVLFSNSGLGRTGQFSGTIVDLGCDDEPAAAGRGVCDAQGEHSYALELDGSRTLYPLLVFGNAPAFDRLRAGQLTGQRVRVGGVHYTSTGTILVSDIE